MKNFVKYIAILAVSGMAFSSCIKETFPEGSTATADQVGGSASSVEAAINGLPAQMAQGYLIYGSQVSELDMGIPGLFLALSECTGELFPLGDAGYDHYQSFNTCKGVGKTSYRSYVPWRTLYILIKSANDVIAATEGATGKAAEYRGMAYAYRAYFYWMLMNMYEPVQNQYCPIDASLLGLTVPMVTDKTTEAEAKNNPRQNHTDMLTFILSDLAQAGELLKNATNDNIINPSVAVVLGLMARVFMSSELYPAAAIYAAAAIAASPKAAPMTQDQWEDVNTGFTKENAAWMWKISYSAENMQNLANWIGWMSGEADWGYASLTMPGIDADLYNNIPDTDFRKHSWLDPDKTKYYDYKTCRDAKWLAAAPDYTSIKFRPLNGNYKDYSTGGACDVPLMRIEEMYYILAEATGMVNLPEGVALLENFVKEYRNPYYSCSATTVDAFQKEILFQKKIEFWGEGIAFFDAKRMKAGCKQSYVGTNAPGDNFKINCEVIKPNWNFVIPETEESSNSALVGKNNPDPSGSVTPDLRY